MRTLVSVTRKITLRNFKRPITLKSAIRAVSFRSFPPIVETMTTTHDIKSSLIGYAEVEVGLVALEVGMVMLSIYSKNLSKNDSGLDRP